MLRLFITPARTLAGARKVAGLEGAREDALSGGGEEGEIAAAVLKEREDLKTIDGPPPWDDEMRRMRMPYPHEGTREELIYWANRNDINIETIDNAFIPYFLMDDINYSRPATFSKLYKNAANELYKEYGGRNNLGDTVIRACKENNCNNPLQTSFDNGERPEEKISDEMIRGLMLQNLVRNNQVTSSSDLFLRRLRKMTSKDVQVSAYWNHEAFWLKTLMKQYPTVVLAAKWDYLYILINNNMDIRKWIEEYSLDPIVVE